MLGETTDFSREDEDVIDIKFSREDEIEKPEWIIPGLRAGQVALVTAPGGTGKSYLESHL